MSKKRKTNQWKKPRNSRLKFSNRNSTHLPDIYKHARSGFRTNSTYRNLEYSRCNLISTRLSLRRMSNRRKSKWGTVDDFIHVICENGEDTKPDKENAKTHLKARKRKRRIRRFKSKNKKLTDVPIELFVVIFEFVPTRHVLLVLKFVCKGFYSVIHSNNIYFRKVLRRNYQINEEELKKSSSSVIPSEYHEHLFSRSVYHHRRKLITFKNRKLKRNSVVRIVIRYVPKLMSLCEFCEDCVRKESKNKDYSRELYRCDPSYYENLYDAYQKKILSGKSTKVISVVGIIRTRKLEPSIKKYSDATKCECLVVPYESMLDGLIKSLNLEISNLSRKKAFGYYLHFRSTKFCLLKSCILSIEELQGSERGRQCPHTFCDTKFSRDTVGFSSFWRRICVSCGIIMEMGGQCTDTKCKDCPKAHGTVFFEKTGEVPSFDKIDIWDNVKKRNKKKK